jgi:hypothetical protein
MVFSQFRSQYPQGSIVTEMLSKVDGLHTFRAIIKDNDVILTTATAADSDLETAEDRAIKRALTILGITFESSYGIQATLMPQITQPLLKTAINSTEHLLESIREPLSDPIRESINESSREQIDEPINYEADKKYSTKYETESVKPTKLEQFKQEPIDLSNQLSQIMVEMERIGWTKQQGKDHLQRKYKKNSRDQLSASEVFDFLEYLKSQSDTF